MTSTVDVLRSGVVESRHSVSVAVADASGRLAAHAGIPDLVTFWRSAAKPFQALALISDGAAEALGITDEELALACASHNGEPRHVSIATGFLEKAGCGPDDLACGPHPSLSDRVAREMAERGETPTRIHSNCSGKHAAMLALTRFHGWPRAGYAEPAHPVQRRCLGEVALWTGIPEPQIGIGVDGCGVACFALPLSAMALAYAGLASGRPGGGDGRSKDARREEAADRIVRAVRADPFLIAGTGRLCTELLEASEGRIVAKVGAAGIYCAALPEAGLGVALKVEDGDGTATNVALLGVLDQLAPGGAPVADTWRRPAVRNTLGAEVGVTVANIGLVRGG